METLVIDIIHIIIGALAFVLGAASCHFFLVWLTEKYG